VFRRKAAVVVEDKYTGEKLAELPLETREELRRKIEAAFKARKRWKLSLEEKVEVVQSLSRGLRKRREEVMELMVREAGQPRKYAEFEYKQAVALTLAYRSMLEIIGEKKVPAVSGSTLLVREPFNLAGIMTARNGPLIMPFFTLTSALGAGVASVLKPPNAAPLTARLVVEELKSSLGEKAELVQFTTASGQDAAWEFVENSLVDVLVVFSSSHIGKDNVIKMGEYLKRQRRKFGGFPLITGKLKKYVPQLGGNDALIVLPSADVDKAVEAAIVGGFANAGQICISPRRFLVHGAVYEEFKEKLVEEVERLKVGDPRDPETDIGPIGSGRVLEIVKHQLRDAERRGAIICGGVISPPFVYPTLVEFSKETVMESEEKPLLWAEESFAPIRTLVRYESTKEAVELANDTAYGLRASIYGDPQEALRIARELDVGMVVINENPLYGDVFMPWGGIKDSGLYGAIYLVEEFTYRKAIHVGG